MIIVKKIAKIVITTDRNLITNDFLCKNQSFLKNIFFDFL